MSVSRKSSRIKTSGMEATTPKNNLPPRAKRKTTTTQRAKNTEKSSPKSTSPRKSTTPAADDASIYKDDRGPVKAAALNGPRFNASDFPDPSQPLKMPHAPVSEQRDDTPKAPARVPLRQAVRCWTRKLIDIYSGLRFPFSHSQNLRCEAVCDEELGITAYPALAIPIEIEGETFHIWLCHGWIGRDNEDESRDQLQGFCAADHREILISDMLAPHVRRQTIFHELTHVWAEMFGYGIHEDHDPEAMANAVGKGAAELTPSTLMLIYSFCNVLRKEATK